jgi:glutamine synthetase
MSGLDGIEKNITLSGAVEEDLYEFDEEKLASRNIDTLPSSLYEAILELKGSKLMLDMLGERLHRRYTGIKMREWNEFKMQVTEWEMEKYSDI